MKEEGSSKEIRQAEKKTNPGLLSDCWQETQLPLAVTSKDKCRSVIHWLWIIEKDYHTQHCDIRGHMLTLINHHVHSLSLTATLSKTETVFP